MGDDKEKWMELCAQAADEQDPHKLAVLILQINALLEAKERRLMEKDGGIRQSAKTEFDATRSLLQSKPI
jgi:hypothetical protein